MEKVTGPLPQVIAHKTPFSECIAFTVVKRVPKREYLLRISLLHTVYDTEGGWFVLFLSTDRVSVENVTFSEYIVTYVNQFEIERT